MCGRYTLSKPGDALEELGVPLAELDGLGGELRAPRYNIAPTQEVLAVRRREAEGELRVSALRWGLIPGWSKRPPERFRPRAPGPMRALQRGGGFARPHPTAPATRA